MTLHRTGALAWTCFYNAAVKKSWPRLNRISHTTISKKVSVRCVFLCRACVTGGIGRRGRAKGRLSRVNWSRIARTNKTTKYTREREIIKSQTVWSTLKQTNLLFHSYKDALTPQKATGNQDAFMKALCCWSSILEISNITHKQGRQLQAHKVQIEVGRFSSKFCSFRGNHFLHKHSLRGDTAVGSSQPWNTHTHKKLKGAHS